MSGYERNNGVLVSFMSPDPVDSERYRYTVHHLDLTTVHRRETIPVHVGDLVIGGNNPVVVQEMTSTPTTDIAKTLKQIQALTDVGCRLIRVAVPSEDAAAALQVLKRETDVPLVADIHFDYRLALLSIESGIDKLRINPGNIGSERKVREVVASAREHAIPIRVGVNSGSLQRDLLDTYGGVTAEGLVESALQEVLLLERAGFQWIVISIKAPDIDLTVRANKLLSERVQYPIHIGITESGYAEAGITRSVVGLGTLLLGGIGDTVRVSLTSRDRTENIRVCRKILQELSIPFT
jgi:(E)-4-hydroxy-3-methylbut-2-enyl-diphosphate synthase